MAVDDIHQEYQQALDSEQQLMRASSDSPTAIESGVSFEVMQQIVQNERQRSRRAFLGISLLFVLLLMIVITVVLVVQLTTVKDLNDVKNIAAVARDGQNKLAEQQRKISTHVEHLSSTSAQLKSTVQEDLAQREFEKTQLRRDLESFSAWHEANSTRLAALLEESMRRLNEMEQAGAVASMTPASQASTAGQEGGAENQTEDGSVVLYQSDKPPAGEKSSHLSASADTHEDVDNPQPPAAEDLDTTTTALSVTEAVDRAKSARAFSTSNVPIEPGEYIGDKLDGKRHGRGVYRFANGDIYDGEFRDDKRHGFGAQHFTNGDQYIGQFDSGRQQGQGWMVYNTGDEYKGGFHNSARHGYGIYTYADGGRYSGDFVDGDRYGKGLYEYPSGAKYEGYFKHGKMHGQGAYTFPDGTRIDGIWREGVIQE